MCNRCTKYRALLESIKAKHAEFHNTAFGAFNDRTNAVLANCELMTNLSKARKMPCEC